jgi:Potato inhibitor I family
VVAGGRLADVHSPEDFQARLAQGHEFAPSLVGLDRNEAIERGIERNFQIQAVTPTAEAITADLSSNRIRIFLDDKGVVVRAQAG